LKRPVASGTLGYVTATATPNERLRTAMQRTGTTIDDLALCCGVDPKSVERWLALGRVPHRANRWDAARRLGYDEDYLWPRAPGRERRDSAAESELVRVYPDRGSVPRGSWHQLLGGAREEISILVHAGLFIAEDPVTRRLLADQAREGVRVRMMLGDPLSALVAKRGEEEGIGAGTVAAKIRNALSFLRPLAQEGLIEIRLHDTTLYNSIYRADDQVLVNAHVYGNTAACAPVLHLRKVSGGNLVTVYLECTERVWEEAKPWNGEDT
jgi:transcriptional regulator with XRE-family HTH domain